jgi:hypothetical protein
MTKLDDVVRDALERLAGEVEPDGATRVPPEVAHRVRRRRARVVASIVAAALLVSGSFVVGHALIEARKYQPTTPITVPPAPPAPCRPGLVSRFVPPSPHVEDILTGVAAISGDDVWAVGRQRPSAPPSFELALIEHWDGTAWQIVNFRASLRAAHR